MIKAICTQSPFSSGSRRTNVVRRWISAAQLTVESVVDTDRFDQRPAKEDLVFGTTLSDHMLQVAWDDQHGWGAPKIVPNGDLAISPAASCLHYGLQCFEGMKAYKSLKDGSLRLFRPDMNMKRLKSSMDRLSMPGVDFDPDELIKCIAELVRTDEKWIPQGEGYSLYLRPTVIATHKFLGLAAPNSLLLFCITSPVGPYYKTGFKPVRLTAETPYIRAWPGGTGSAKVGGNYAATMKAQADAVAHGYSQVLWLYKENGQDTVTEVGAMNVFFCIADPETGTPELVTAPLDRGDILPGVTRDSILHLARGWGNLNVSERFLSMQEVMQASQEGRLLEAFGAGTAAVVTPISCIRYRGQDIEIPATGDVTHRVWDEVTGIQYGTIEGPPGWSVVIS